MTGPRDKKKASGGTPALSDEDAELWARVAAQAEPLPALRRARHVQTLASVRAKASAKNKPAKSQPSAAPTSASVRTPASSKTIRPQKALKSVVQQNMPAPATRLEPKSKRRLARGSIEIEARLDLHGLSAAQARTRFVGFISAAVQAKQKWVLVITGKGRAGTGVLRREVPLWLAEPPMNQLVIAYEPAAAAHGGDGALYLRLRRR